MKTKDLLSEILLDGFQDENSEPFNFKIFIFQYLNYWWLFLIGLSVFVTLAVGYIYFATPRYLVTSTLLIKVDKGVDFTKNAVFSDLEVFESSNKVENEMEILGSYSLMRGAIEELPLHASFYVEGKFSKLREIYGSEVPIIVEVHELNPLGKAPNDDKTLRLHLKQAGFAIEDGDGKLKEYQFGEKIKNWYGTISIEKADSQNEETPEILIVSLNNKDQVAAGYASALKVKLSNKFASVVNLELVDAVAEKGIDIMNSLVNVYNQEAVREKNIIAKNTIDFIDEQLIAITNDLGNIERQAENYKKVNTISDLSSESEFFVQNTAAYEARLSINNTQLEVLESIENYMRNPESQGNEVPSSLTIEDATLAGLVVRFNQLQGERERYLRTLQPGNPLILNLEDQLQSVKRNILTNLNNIKNSLTIENRNLKASIGTIGSRISRVPEIERGLLEISRQQEIKQEHYIYLIKKREESQLSLAATTVSNSRIIDAASAGGSPVSPNKILVLGFAMVMGFGLPFSYVYLKTNLSGKIKEKTEVKNILSLPIIGEISHNDKKEILAISEKRRTPIAEQFRLLRTNLKYLNKGFDDKVILVTSSTTGEGKTFFSLNLGVSLSLTKKRVILLEFDLRKPALLKSCNLESKKGLSDYLSGNNIKIEDIIIPYQEVPDLFFIGCGQIPEDPAELMLGAKVGHLIDQLKERFDHIIIDTAPIGTVADGFNLAPYIDYTLFMVRYNYSTKSSLQFVKEMEIQKMLKRPMVVMNDAKIQGGFYGYGYGYEDKNKYLKKVYS